MAEERLAQPASGAAVRGRIAMTGGTGFVGGALRQALSGRPLRLIARQPPAGAGDVETAVADVTRPETLAGTLDGCAAVIHLVAIIAEEGNQTFDRVIRQGTVNVVAEARRAGVPRFILMSALGARHDPHYDYLEAKWQAEQAVQHSGLAWTIFRPSIIFGPGDGFINALADVVRTFPAVPVVGAGTSKFQPVAAGDVAAAFVRALDDPATVGQLYELGGPDILTYEQILDLISQTLAKRKPKVHVPVGLMRQVVRLSRPLPAKLRPPVTPEQLKMLALDNCTDESATATLIGRPPLPLRGNIEYIRS